MNIRRALAIGTAVVAISGGLLAWGVIDYFTVSEDELSTAPDGSRYIDYQPPLARLMARCDVSAGLAAPEHVAFVQNGLRRDFLYYAPPSRRAPAPVLFVLHGSGSSAAQIHALLGDSFIRLADREGVAIIYGNGFAGGWNDLRTRSPHLAKTLDIDEVGYFREILSWAERELGVARNAVDYVGMSNGAQMIMKLLVDAPELVTAAALVGANLPQTPALDDQCGQMTPRPVMFVNGTDDNVVPYDGGKVRVMKLFDFGSVHSADKTAMCWVASAGLHVPPQTTHIDTLDDGTSIDLRRWSEPGKPEVRAYRVNGGRHTIPMPPRGNPCDELLSTSGDMNTIEEAWSFFRTLSREPLVLGLER